MFLAATAGALLAFSTEPAEMKADFARRAEDELRKNILPYWIEHAPDRSRGGFIAKLDLNEVVDPDAARGALLTSRILWTFSAAHRRWPDGGYLEMATRARDDLLNRFWDDENGGLFWTISADGEPLDTRKQIYGQSFGIYALSEYYRTTGDTTALDRAVELFHLFERHVRDPAHGGYFEIFSADWKPLDPSAAAVIGKSGGVKSQNSHLHIMEAFTNLLRVWPDPELKQAQHDLVNLMLGRVLDRKTWHLGLFFDDDWTPVSTGVSYGHDIEAAWLMTEAAEVVGDSAQIASTREAAVEIARVTLAEGIDADGSLLYDGEPDGPTNFTKAWWPQAEGVVGFLEAWQISADAQYMQAAERLWTFIGENFVDRRHGGWFGSLTRERVVQPGEKIGFWKCPYHNGRACMEIIDRLGSAPLEQPSPKR